MRLEPLSLAAAFTLGVQLLWAGSYQESLEHLRRSAELAPTVPAAHSRLATVLLARGMHREAIAEFQRAMDLADGHPYARAMLAHAYGVSGRAAEAKTLLRELIASAEHAYVPPLHLARTYLGLGERDQALDWLERSYADPASSAWPFHLVDPMFENLRGEPRFVALLKKVHLR
jgi:serine/threonine-protein kinase